MSTEGRIALQPGYVLHRTPYRDTSLLVEAFTPDYGRVGLVARGARGRRSTQQAILQPFQPLLLSWSGRGDLFTLTGVESDGVPPGLAGDAVLSGFYMNELIMRLLQRHDPHPELYHSYRQTLAVVRSDAQREWGLRLFERDLLQEIGYGLQLVVEADSGDEIDVAGNYCYHSEYGPRRADSRHEECLAVSGETLLALASGQQPGTAQMREAKRLMRSVLQGYLGNRPLASRELFRARSAFRGTMNTDDDNEE